MPITPREFVDLWAQSQAREQQAAQTHFNQLCQLVGHKTPLEADPACSFFTFEEHVTKATGGKGRADVWFNGHFAWEYKGKHKSLDTAYAQLLTYKSDLGNPPLLVVCDFLEYRIYPQWPNTSGQPFVFRNEDLLHKDAQRYITWLLEDPHKFLEARQADLERRERITLSLAEKFAHLYDLMQNQKTADGQPLWQPLQIARFLTKLVFALFAEDIGLLPRPNGQNLLRYIFRNAPEAPDEFVPTLQELFQAMDGQKRSIFMRPVPYFNGGLFADSGPGANDGIEALNVMLLDANIGLQILEQVSEADWREVNPTIFGTLFEGALDERKRAQLGAHYTSEADIRLIVEPVLMEPLYRQWESIQAEAAPLMQTYLKPDTPPRDQQAAKAGLTALFDQMMSALENTRVLDPACGSGNFLYVSLRALKDLEARVRKWFEPLGPPFRDVVTPRQLYGIEKDPFAARLAHVVTWIGYLQWRYEDEGVLHPFIRATSSPHPRQLPHPIIQDKYRPDEPEHIRCADAILNPDGTEPDWPPVDVIMGNPPFFGDKKMRGELGSAYVDTLRNLYDERVPGGADLVCYWYEKARAQIERGSARRAGLLATQSIRTGASRQVLDRIKQTGDIFMAWSDRPWVLEGAAVRISVVGFDAGVQKDYTLDGAPVTHINSDLQNTIDATKARVLPENGDMAFQGPVKVGAFDIPDELARSMLNAVNPSGHRNADVVKPYLNGNDIVQRSRNYWIIDFGLLSEAEAAQYEAPFQYVETTIKPERINNCDQQRREHWWRLGRSGEDYKQSVRHLKRQIFTPRVARHRIFVWADANVLPDSRVFAICRADDYCFGVLHSIIHEKWSVRLASRHGVGNDPTYNAQSCFETFPFPWPPGKEDTASPAYPAIAAAAKQLHEERALWLNPPELTGPQAGLGDAEDLKKRTLTNLYNALVVYRANGGRPSEREAKQNGLTAAARDFAPRLVELHDALDHAVCAAYGWPVEILQDEEELLRRLLALNLSWAGG